MSICIIKSNIHFSQSMLMLDDKGVLCDSYYYMLSCHDKNFMSKVVFKDRFKQLIEKSCQDSKYMDLWKDKESMYSFEKEEDICFSQEYYSAKSKITEDAFRALIITDDQEVFIVRAEIVGTFKKYVETGKLEIMFILEYLDSVCNTQYDGVSFDSLKSYFATRGLGTL